MNKEQKSLLKNQIDDLMDAGPTTASWTDDLIEVLDTHVEAFLDLLVGAGALEAIHDGETEQEVWYRPPLQAPHVHEWVISGVPMIISDTPMVTVHCTGCAAHFIPELNSVPYTGPVPDTFQ